MTTMTTTTTTTTTTTSTTNVEAKVKRSSIPRMTAI